jgi:hypothetical protein
MSDPVAADPPALHSLNTVAGAMETAVQAAKHGAVDAKQAVENAMPAVSRFVSRFVYTTCYSLSYGIVFPSVFLARAIPKENQLVHGLVDGAHAAMAKVEDWHQSRSGSAPAEPSSPTLKS